MSAIVDDADRLFLLLKKTFPRLRIDRCTGGRVHFSSPTDIVVADYSVALDSRYRWVKLKLCRPFSFIDVNGTRLMAACFYTQLRRYIATEPDITDLVKQEVLEYLKMIFRRMLEAPDRPLRKPEKRTAALAMSKLLIHQLKLILVQQRDQFAGILMLKDCRIEVPAAFTTSTVVDNLVELLTPLHDALDPARGIGRNCGVCGGARVDRKGTCAGCNQFVCFTCKTCNRSNCKDTRVI